MNNNCAGIIKRKHVAPPVGLCTITITDTLNTTGTVNKTFILGGFYFTVGPGSTKTAKK